MPYYRSLINDNPAVVLTPIRDEIGKHDTLGNLILFPDCAVSLVGDQIRSVNQIGSRETNNIGAFVFHGTNLNYFHQYINSLIPGSYTVNSVFVNSGYINMVSIEFKELIKKHIMRYLEVSKRV